MVQILYSKIGGEVGNSVILGYSNKGHDGYMGNSVLGEWCNLGADTNTSNLKNTYDEVRLWSYVDKRFAHTEQNFLGLIMGDHSKAGINTMFNTGTVVGVASNIFGEGYPRNFIASFAWGGYSGFISHKFEKAIETAKIVTARRNIPFTQDDEAILRHIFEISEMERSWEKKVGN
jgi:UDP-N-acetylglucosamine diphosphorylase/glucosamine-1-phosphate N-acetyltransferase